MTTPPLDRADTASTRGSTRGKAFLHVGLPKTGTSYLQSHLWSSPQQLAEAGVRMVPDGPTATFRIMRAVRGQLDAEGRADVAASALKGLQTLVAEATEPTLLLSQESLNAARPKRAAALIDCFAGREVHLVVTARDVARQLPSAWQQWVKAKGDIGFMAYLRAVETGGAAGKAFLGTQDLVRTFDIWARHLPPERVHVVVVPPRHADRNLLAERFGSVVGVDFSELQAVDLRPNYSLDPVQVELVRRVNRLKGIRRRFEYARTVKQFFCAQILAPHRGEAAKTPVGMRAWCDELARTQVAFIREQGYDVVGDLDELMPREEDFGPPLEEIEDAQLAAVAVPAISDLLVRHNETEKELARLREEVGELTAELEQLRSSRPKLLGFLK